ncbi:WD40 repeat-like protein [Ascodesmis nigricans]|uniref:WD40 repeat-like protein n=1 Tax=Ascodesmis nigricans TaxID=341454 RepID=A0A4S2MTE6_9PEZI|nr:WD40 repeat-like protein [Ascodesmis nigricans]
MDDEDGMDIDEEDGDEEDDSVTARSKSSSTSSRKHVMEDGVNGAPKKRRKRAPQPSDEDVAMTDIGSPPTPADEQRMTNGRSVGIQSVDFVEVSAADTVVIGMEDGGVEFCAWNPVDPGLLATGCERSVAHLWAIPEDVDPESCAPEGLSNHIMSHQPPLSGHKSAGITALQWSADGSRLATGSMDGQTRIWNTESVMEHNLSLHWGPVGLLRWNNSGDFLLALSCDGKMVVWDTASGNAQQSFEIPGEEIVRVEWISRTQFMSAGDNGRLHLFDVAHGSPLFTHAAHQGEVGSIAWDEESKVLATGGNDGVVKLWSDPKPGKATSPRAVALEGHSGPVVDLDWRPVQKTEGSKITGPRILASASHDRTIRLWDTVSSTVLRVLKFHVDPLETIRFSSDGNRIASGTNGNVIVWNTDSGAITHIYDRSRGRRKNGTIPSPSATQIHELSWEKYGNRLAIAGGVHGCAIVALKSLQNGTPSQLKSGPGSEVGGKGELSGVILMEP